MSQRKSGQRCKLAPFVDIMIPRLRECIMHHLMAPGWKPFTVRRGPWHVQAHV